MGYQLSKIQNLFTALQYQSFTFPIYRPRLLALEPGLVAIAAHSDDQPIGLALAKLGPNPSAEILSIFVAPEQRHCGVATALLQQLETELIARNCNHASMVYVTGAYTPILERLLEKLGWSQPQPRQLVCNGDRHTLQAPCLQKHYRLPAGFEIFPWLEISPEKRRNLEIEHQANPWIPVYLLPSSHESTFEPLNSLGMCYQGRVVGWLITHRLAADTIRYTSGFVHPDLQKRGRLLPLIVEAAKRQAASMPNPKAIWTVPYQHPTMINFVKKHLADYMVSLADSRGVSKQLAANLALQTTYR